MRSGVAGNQEYTIVFSAGNAGAGAQTIGSPGTGKNIITVGAAEDVNPFGGSDGCGTSDAQQIALTTSSHSPVVDQPPMVARNPISWDPAPTFPVVRRKPRSYPDWQRNRRAAPMFQRWRCLRRIGEAFLSCWRPAMVHSLFRHKSFLPGGGWVSGVDPSAFHQSRNDATEPRYDQRVAHERSALHDRRRS